MAAGVDALTQRINPRFLISLSMVIVALLPCAWIGEVVFFTASAVTRPKARTASASGPVVVVREMQPLGTFRTATRSRDLFAPPVEKELPKAKEIGIEDLAKNLELSGIIDSGVREAIIQDRRTRQSYYVNEGSTVGELLVEKIEPDKVILAYKEEKYELKIV